MARFAQGGALTGPVRSARRLDRHRPGAVLRCVHDAGDPRERTELWLVRHGESVANAGGIFQGQHEYPLNERGREQAAALAARLATVRFDAVYCSDLGRARETAGIVCAAAGGAPVEDRGLREIDTGSWSGLTPDQIRERFADEWDAWMSRRDPAHRRGGGESYGDVQRRMIAAIDAIAGRHPGGRVLVVAHGGCLTAWIAWLLEIPLPALWRCALANTGISRALPYAPPPTGMATKPGRLLVHNDTAHLENAMSEHAT